MAGTRRHAPAGALGNGPDAEPGLTGFPSDVGSHACTSFSVRAGRSSAALRPLVLLAACLLGGSTVARAQPSSLAARGGADTIGVIVAHIRAARQASYETWLREVVAPAVGRATRRFPSLRAEWANQQLLVPAERTDDSTVTFVYVLDISKTDAEGGVPEPQRSRARGWRALFEDAGMSGPEIERQLTALRAMQRASEYYTLVRGRLPGAR